MNTLPKKPKNKCGRRRWNLWVKDTHCYWCKRELEWNETTLDHLFQRTKLGDECRPILHNQETTVLSCSECNSKREREAFNEMNKVHQWIRDNNIPPIRRAWGKRKTPIYARLWVLYYYLIKNLKNNYTFFQKK